MAPPLILLGLPNNYRAIPFAFPGAVRLEGLRELLDALVKRNQWKGYHLINKVEVVLGEDRTAFKVFIEGWRARAA